ncbi:periplasmic nitrate reductase, electron transfer subunit [Neiella marina]|uniref:Periplasmic nitrate reductase, electron transfer subunit n=1 Tax=Neiella marina TaxID=508461 RepID=A0A8J2U863_9GAMM|nr:nitrate reductase cytochrome c-type subunit [Neiella marina]GGA86017.1 periplasmic nitrate reductase, electron transfer subunit [Neiella marina]
MKTLISSMVASLLLVTSWATANAVDNEDYVSNGGLSSLRGASELNDTKRAEQLKKQIKDDQVIDRNYVHQPPLIPHQIRDYQVDLKSNKCLSCHGWKFAGQIGATKISPTHFETADGLTLSDVAPRRYFCLQCHVPQADAPPLIANDFQAVEALDAANSSR